MPQIPTKTDVVAGFNYGIEFLLLINLFYILGMYDDTSGKSQR